MLRWLRRLLRIEVVSVGATAEVEAAKLAAKSMRLEQEQVKASANAHVAAARRRTDTRRRVVNAQASKMSSVFLPRDGKSIEQLALEELEREERRAMQSPPRPAI